jgi:hypothetical protein
LSKGCRRRFRLAALDANRTDAGLLERSRVNITADAAHQIVHDLEISLSLPVPGAG